MTVARSFVSRLVLLVALAGSLGGVRVFEEAECTSAYNYLAGCLTFVSGPDTIPNPICCGGVHQLNSFDPHCLCTIIRQLDENPNVNYTKACALPLQCSVEVDVVECPSLKLPPGYALPPSLPVEEYINSGEQSAAMVQFRPGGGVTWGISFVGLGISLLGIL